MPPRLANWDYAANGAYFLTSCTYRRAPILGTVDADGVHPSPLGTLVARQLVDMTRDRPGVRLDCWVVMPDHLHFIVLIDGDPPAAASIRMLVAAFKATATNAARRDGFLARCAPLWQRSFYDRVIRNDEELRELRQYVTDNPTRWVVSGR